MQYPGRVAALRRERPPAERSITSGKRSSTTSARAHAPTSSSQASSGSRKSRSPITSPTLLSRSGGRLSGCAWSRPSVWTAASSSRSGPASTGPRPAPFAGITTLDPRASPSKGPEPDLQSCPPQKHQGAATYRPRCLLSAISRCLSIQRRSEPARQPHGVVGAQKCM